MIRKSKFAKTFIHWMLTSGTRNILVRSKCGYVLKEIDSSLFYRSINFIINC